MDWRVGTGNEISTVYPLRSIPEALSLKGCPQFVTFLSPYQKINIWVLNDMGGSLNPKIPSAYLVHHYFGSFVDGIAGPLIRFVKRFVKISLIIHI